VGREGASIDREERAPETLEDTAEEAIRLVAAAGGLGVPLRLIGGTAVWLRCPSAHTPPLAREYGDIDFVSLSKKNGMLSRFFEDQGYEADKLFNALHGAQRLNFTDPRRGRPVDVLLDRFVMCHTLELKERLAVDDTTIPLADLLLTKAQVVQLNEKDIKDIVALLLDHPIAADAIDPDRLAEATRGDWGLEHTLRKTLQEVQEAASGIDLGDEGAAVVKNRSATILGLLEAAPKSARWRMRARVGERLRWYEEPEEARR
jgi:hypothetical protein